MSNLRIDNTTITDQETERYEVEYEGDTGNVFYTYTPQWIRYNSYYKLPEVKQQLDKIAIWTVGKGYTSQGRKTKEKTRKIKGTGKETFNTILLKAVKTYQIVGDYFAEIIRDGNNEVANLKTLNPGRVQIKIDEMGEIQEYRYLNQYKQAIAKWKPEEILHLCWNPDGDNPHGTSELETLINRGKKKQGLIEDYNEVKKDLKTVFRRYARPLLITSVDSDDEKEIEKFKSKMDKAVKEGENLIVPKETVDNIDKISVPQYSTLDPLPYIQKIDEDIIRTLGVPKIIQGEAQQTTEATAKMLYLAFEQLIEWHQKFLEEQIENQLNLRIKLEFPADLLNDLQGDEQKDGQTDTKTNNE